MDTWRPKTNLVAVLETAKARKIQDYDLLDRKYPNVVVAGGDGVTLFKVGDRVSDFAAVIYIPVTMTFEEGSASPMASVIAAIDLFVI
ncbi:040d2a7b-7d44-4a08-a9fe-9f88990f28d4 [Sclerotinia trifoliorum]|uniref:040d2a7b-7d44-4a08-a9fe-9f88990f28d4 n=1 Tax=Sclerotinia trifoliorum TaxID=28548 RepID=A0A8H2VLT0_9HELO|nr:040d2a7b-7d44-4a08-a9fe-9f88990f28d4 [Sclerotinia trifoliorum]